MNVCDIDKQVVPVVHGPPFQPSKYHCDRIPLFPNHFFPADNIPFQSYMAPPRYPIYGLRRSRDIFPVALSDYTHQTGIELAEHPLAEGLQDANSVESVTAILCEQAQGFKEFREKDKVLKPLKKVLTILHPLSSTALSSTATFARRRDGTRLVCP